MLLKDMLILTVVLYKIVYKIVKHERSHNFLKKEKKIKAGFDFRCFLLSGNILIVLCSFLLLQPSHVEAASFDYFTLAFQWPITYCSDKKTVC